MSASNGALKHHFKDIEQQRGAERLGMWMFLVTEVLFFGGAFFAYTVYRLWYPKDFAAISGELNVAIALINTILLLVSSLTITLAIRATQLGNRSAQLRNLFITAFLGTAFMGFKAYEYYSDYKEGLVPWAFNFGKEPVHEIGADHSKDKSHDHGHHGPTFLEKWEKDGVSPNRVKMFLFFYYALTGIHGVHLIVGIALVLYLWVRGYVGNLGPAYYANVEVISLYWHLVDMIWLFLMPLLYLAGPHSMAQFKHQLPFFGG
jgi:cytochrome c oxidase subunit III